MFYIDEAHTLYHPKNRLETINRTIRSTNFNGSKCQFGLPATLTRNTQVRCEPCKQLLRHCVRNLSHRNNLHPSLHSTTKLASLDQQQLTFRCQKMAEYIRQLKKTNSRLQMRLNQEKSEENLIQLPKNVNLTALKLSFLVELALSKQCLDENSVLYALLCDTVTSLIKSEMEKNSETGKRSHPKGMRFHPVVLKWCVELANRCGKGGYELIRDVLPIPCISTVNAYRQTHKSCETISRENFNVFSQELTRRNSKGIGGIHWDEIHVRKGIKVCARTNELIGFEDLQIPTSISEPIAFDDHLPEEQIHVAAQTSETDSGSESSSEDSSASSNEEQKTSLGSPKPIAKIILQFFWSSLEGDFTWPVSSFPLHKINAKTLSHCVWNTVKALSKITFGNNNEKQVQVLYGVCDGATHSSAFFNQQGQINWMVDNPYNNNKPIFWLSDPPQMIKKLRNFIISQNRHLCLQGFQISLSHLMEVAERGLTKLSYKHLFLTSRNKMSVKRAVETCSSDVADDMMLHSKYGFQETLMTRMYLRKVAKYFRIMNSTSLEQDALPHLLQVLLFFKRWNNNIEETIKTRTSTLKEHWKQFISKHTYKDLTRSIRGFIGLVSYVQLNHSNVVIVPRTTNQDDVENYFSLQRRRIAGGEVTVQQYLEGNASLATDLLIKAEKNDMDSSSFIGSYSAVVTPNYVSVPLKRKKSIVRSKAEITKEPCSNFHQNEYDLNLQDEEVNKFHSQKDEHQLYRQVQQVFDYINVKSSSVIIGYGQRLVGILREEQNRKLVMQFLKYFNYKLRHNHFLQGLKMAWNRLLIQINMCHEGLEANQKSTTEVFGTVCDKFSKRRCVTFLAIDQLNPRSEEQQTAICQLLRTFEKGSEKSYLSSKPTDKCFKCGEEGHWAKECKKEIPHDSAWLQRQRCYTCGQYGHLKKDCELAITNCKLYRNMTPKVKGINIDHDPLTIQLLRLPEVKLKDHPKLVNIQLCDGSGIHPSERFLQGSDAWEEARKGKINGSWAACALGWRGRQEMMKYEQEVKTDQGT